MTDKFMAFNLEKDTIQNPYYRRVIYTDSDMQIVLMTLQPGDTIHREKHSVTQFFRVEKGQLQVTIADQNIYNVPEDYSFVVPIGVYHEIKNLSRSPVNLYTIYGGPTHKPGTIQMFNPGDGKNEEN